MRQLFLLSLSKSGNSLRLAIRTPTYTGFMNVKTIFNFFTLKIKVLEVECPPGKVVGYVEQNLNCYRPTYDICGPEGDAQYVIEGPSSCKTWCRSWTGKFCYLIARRKRCCCFGRDIVFNISHAETGEKLGDLSKLWAGPLEKQRGLADFDRFGIDFPDEADVEIKVVMVASCFLIDYLYFEGDNDDDD